VSLICDTAREPAAAANEIAVNKIAKYGELENINIFFPVAIETAGAWNHLAIELVQEIGRRITAVKEEPRESMFLFQRLSIYNSPPEGERGCLPGNVQHRVNAVRSHYLLIMPSSLRLCASGP